MKQMKALFVAALVLFSLAGVALASSASEVEVRSTVLNLSNIGSGVDITGDDWAGLYFDIDEDIKTETLNVTTVSGNKINITYTTIPAKKEYDSSNLKESGNTDYYVIGFFAEPYVALRNDSDKFANKIGKLILDSNDKFTLKAEQKIDLGQGYTLTPTQIDVNGEKVFLVFEKDGKEIDSGTINTNTSNKADKIWTVEQDILDEKDIQVLRVYVDSVFQGSSDSYITIKGIWLMDVLGAFEVKDDKDYGSFECDVADSDELKYTAENVSLSQDSKKHVGNGIYVKTSSNFNSNKQFYFVKTYTDEGTYDIRSSVFDYGSNATYDIDYTKAAFFYYDLDDDISTETLNVTITGSKIKEGDLVYKTKVEPKKYETSKWNIAPNNGFKVLGLFGDIYVPLQENSDESGAKIFPEKIAKLLLDTNSKYTLTEGQKIDLGGGYTLTAVQIDVNGEKAQIRFEHDGKEIDTGFINPETDGTWVCEEEVLDEDDIQVLRVRVNSVFQGSSSSMIEIKGLWLMDYLNAFEVEEDDKYGKLDLKTIGSDSLEFESNTNISLSRDQDTKIYENWSLKTADSNSNKNFYFYVSKKITGDDKPTPPETDDPKPTVTPKPTDTVKPDPKPTDTVKPDPKPTQPVDDEPPQKESFLKKYGLWIAIILIIIVIAAAGYYYYNKKKNE